ncbi:hypothetical protein GCM10027290_65420 [Micromonospora sonneratiae]
MKEVQNSDDGLQHAKKIANSIQDAVRPSGTVVPKGPGVVVRAPEAQTVHAGDVMLTAFVVAVAGIKGAEIVGRLRRKMKPKPSHEKSGEQ